MSPRGALVPLLTVLGTTAAAAVVAQKFIPQYMARKYRRRRMESLMEGMAQPEEELENSGSSSRSSSSSSIGPRPDLQQPQDDMKHGVDDDGEVEVKALPPRSTMAIAMLLQDGYMLFSVFGVFVMVITVLVSLALVGITDDLESPSDLRMFAPLMFTSMAMVAAGLLASMLFQPSFAQRTHTRKLSSSSSNNNNNNSNSMHKSYQAATVAASGTTIEQQVPKKRVSKCPLGFT